MWFLCRFCFIGSTSSLRGNSISSSVTRSSSFASFWDTCHTLAIPLAIQGVSRWSKKVLHSCTLNFIGISFCTFRIQVLTKQREVQLTQAYGQDLYSSIPILQHFFLIPSNFWTRWYTLKEWCCATAADGNKIVRCSNYI